MIVTASLLTSIALKSLVLAGLTLGLLRLARQRTPSERSLIAHAGLLAILLLPAASLMLPEWAPFPQASGAIDVKPATTVPSDLAEPAQAAGGVSTLNSAEPAIAPLPPGDLAVWLYGLPVAGMFAMMALAVLRLFAMRRRAEVLVDGAWLAALAGAQRRMGYKYGTALLVSEELCSPISWGVLRPTILLDPRAVSAVGDAEAIIAHELAHVARFDWAKLLIARLACALFWFNPLVWLLARESHQLREEAADDTVLLTDIPGSDYAALLVNAARHDNSGVLIAAHGVAPAKGSLRRRVIRALDPDALRRPGRAGWGALSLATLLGVAAPLAAFTTAATRPVEQTVVLAREASAERTERPAGSAQRAATAAPLSADDLVAMRAVGVEPADLDRFRDAKGAVDPDTAIAAKALAIDADYALAMQSVFRGVDIEDLVGARGVGVDADFARAMRAIDPQADFDEVISARAVGVTPEYASQMRRYFPDLSLDDLVSMRAVGVTGAYVRAMREAGMEVGSPDDAIDARALSGGRIAPSTTPQPPAPPARATGNRRSAMPVPSGILATRRNADGSVATAIVQPAQPPVGSDE